MRFEVMRCERAYVRGSVEGSVDRVGRVAQVTVRDAVLLDKCSCGRINRSANVFPVDPVRRILLGAGALGTLESQTERKALLHAVGLHVYPRRAVHETLDMKLNEVSARL